MSAAAAVPTDYFSPELRQLSATAIDVLDKHVGDQGRCTACGAPWPCEPAQLAEHNLAGL
jgi:hypothetical protein